MRLYLVQHGEAVEKTEDPDRPLTAKGRADVARVGGFLAATGIWPARILHSGKTRARQTAEALAHALSAPTPDQMAGLAPKDPVDALVRQLEQWSEDLMLIGHQPFMSRLVSLLLKGEEDAVIVAFRPGSVACLARDEESGDWCLDWMVRPELLG